VFAASLYIIVCTAKNRLRVRVRRLREPRYVIGAIAGGAYLYFTLFARMWGGRLRSRARRGPAPPMVWLETFRTFGPTAVGTALLALMAVGWIVPSDSTLLEFTEAEVQFLFTAPVARRALLVHRLLRSQLALLFASVVPAFFLSWTSPMARVRFAVAMWVLLTVIKVHFTGITLVRTSLAIHDAKPRGRQWGVLVIAFGAVAIVAIAVVRSLLAQPVAGVEDAFGRLGVSLTTGLPRIVLLPFTMIALPLFSEWPGPYLTAMAGSVLVLLINVAWVLRSDEALQEAAAEAEARRAARSARRRPTRGARARGWTLAPSGRPEMVFVWKNAMQTLRQTSLATIVRFGAPFIIMTLGLSSGLMGRAPAMATLLGSAAAVLAMNLVLFGPQIVRTDLRQDLLHLDLLKTWPVGSAAIIRGEMLWPGAILTVSAWVAIVCAVVWLGPGLPSVSFFWRASGACAAIVLAPALVFAQLTIHNAVAVLLPAWVSLGSSRPRGLDAMGQRLIMFAAVIFGLLLMLAPGGLAGGIVWFAFSRLIGPAALPAAAAAFTLVVVIEILLATEALGPPYERLDATSVDRAE
jgi:hypothetical protein